MDAITWTFARGDANEERLTIVRETGVAPPSVRLIITGEGATRSFDFTDATAAVRFQSDMEAFLLRTGWSFIAFAPEHRAGRDRRTFPRLRERRRWWTDGTISLKQFLGWDEFRWPAKRSSASRRRDGGEDPT